MTDRSCRCAVTLSDVVHNLPMPQARPLTRAVLAFALLLTLAVALFLFLREDPRDEAAFRGYVTHSTPGAFATINAGTDPHQW
jgi:hypothetical protein